MARRRNARRTWPDGSGCEQRPLLPHEPGCKGWDWSGPRTRPRVMACEDCAIFDDDADAAEHVSRCAACLEEFGSPGAAQSGYPMPRRAKRALLAEWANDEDILRGSGRLSIPVLASDSTKEEIAEWLEMAGAGVYEFADEAEAWHQLAQWAPEELFTHEIED